MPTCSMSLHRGYRGESSYRMQRVLQLEGEILENVIITRHPSAIQWLQGKGYSGRVIPELTDANIQSNTRYIGILPVSLIQKVLRKGSKFYLLQLPSVVFEHRGKELTVEEMDQAGAQLVEILEIKTREVRI